MTNTPAVPRLIPLTVILPREYPRAAIANTDNIRNEIVFTDKYPPNRLMIFPSFFNYSLEFYDFRAKRAEAF